MKFFRPCLILLLLSHLMLAAGCQERVSTKMDPKKDIPNQSVDAGDPYEIVDEYYGLTRLHAAARDGDLVLLETLLKNGADPDTPDRSAKSRLSGSRTARSPIHWALNREVVDTLVQHGADIEHPAGAPPISPIAHLALKNRNSAVERLIELGAKVDARDSMGMSPLLWCLTGLVMGIPDDELHENKDIRLRTACLLIENGADVNQSDSGSTVLGTAIKYAPEFLPKLLELGADPEIPDNGKTPLEWATEWKDGNSIRVIKDAIESKRNAK